MNSTNRKLKKLITIFFLFVIAFVSNTQFANAQANVVIDTTLPKHIIVFEDSRLEVLKNRPAAMRKMIEAELAKKDTKKFVKPVEVYNPLSNGNKTLTGSITQKQGFRILIYSSTDRVAALKVKSDFSRNYTGTRSYFNYNVPNYKIKVGDFEDKKSATAFMKSIIKAYPQAAVVPDIVTVKHLVIQTK